LPIREASPGCSNRGDLLARDKAISQKNTFFVKRKERFTRKQTGLLAQGQPTSPPSQNKKFQWLSGFRFPLQQRNCPGFSPGSLGLPSSSYHIFNLVLLYHF
jgi:hypothetical protein